MSCGRHTTRRQAHATRRAKTSHTVRKASHNARRQSTTNVARKATSAHRTHKVVRAMSKARPKASKTSSPGKPVKRRLSAAQLKARNRRHRILSARARAHARAVAYAKVRAEQKAAAARRAAHKTQRSHAKTQRLYCRVATRHAAAVSTPSGPRQYYYRRLQMAYASGNKAGQQAAYKGLKAAGPSKASRAGRSARAAKAAKG